MFHLCRRAPKSRDAIRQNPAAPVDDIDCEKPASTGDFGTNIIRHVVMWGGMGWSLCETLAVRYAALTHPTEHSEM